MPASPRIFEHSANPYSVPVEFSDDALALEFSQLHGHDLRYTAAWGRWACWNGQAWEADETRRVLDLARDCCRHVSESCQDRKLARHVASARTIAAVERLAQADRRHAATVGQWDADPWILNTPGGVVDLRRGEVRAARREDYCTKTTAVTPGGECSLWRAFLACITAGDRSLENFLQRMCGYILTGVTQEHAMFFLYGTGANGKSKFVEAISGALGDYTKVAPIETFIDSKNQNHPTDVAGLQGARLVTAIETEEGRRWAESKVKTLTGGDPVAARFMRQDFFEYIPQFKLVVAGNHRPGLRTVDEAMRRRFNLLPFTVTIPPEERDQELGEKLKSEWAGILQWAIEGCVEWQRKGLNPAAAVIRATQEYFVEEDALARWIEERIEVKDGFFESASGLFKDWKTWAEAAGEFVGTQKRFSVLLEDRGYRKDRKSKARGFSGIALRNSSVTGYDASVYSPSRARVEDIPEIRHNPSGDAELWPGKSKTHDEEEPERGGFGNCSSTAKTAKPETINALQPLTNGGEKAALPSAVVLETHKPKNESVRNGVPHRPGDLTSLGTRAAGRLRVEL
jgi:putative DNA primase/helicase